MSDAERIAEYMTARQIQPEPFTADDALALAAKNPSGQCGSLLAMLSDVRREEREACLADIAAEQREWAGDHPRSALDCARERIVKHGAK
jgi:hypothetical protein